jgi:Uma2 family endonuclease
MSSTAIKLLTAEEFFQWAQLPANRGHRFELRGGEVIEMPPPGKYHGFVCGNVAGILRNYAISRHKGYVCTNDAGVIVGRDPDSVRGPEITFYEDDQTAADMERQYATVPPLLAVEVVSPSDRINEVRFAFQYS